MSEHVFGSLIPTHASLLVANNHIPIDIVIRELIIATTMACRCSDFGFNFGRPENAAGSLRI